MAAGEPFAWPALRWIMVREARVVPSEAGPDHVLALMPVAAVALLESAYPIGVTAALLGASGRAAMDAADEPCHAGEQRDRLVRVTDQRYRQRRGRLNVDSQEAADHPQARCRQRAASRDGSIPAAPDQDRAAGAGCGGGGEL